MVKITALKKTAPDFRVGFIFMLFSVIMLCVPKTDAAIVSDGDFETDINLPVGNPVTSDLPSWAPTNSPDGKTVARGVDPAYYNSVFGSLVSTGGGTPGGSVSAVFVTSPVGGQISMASISQHVSTTPGKFYDIRLWVANMSTTGPTGSTAPDLGARENLFSIKWGSEFINLADVDPVHFAAPNPLNLSAAELDPLGVGITDTYVLTATGGWTLVTFQRQASSTTTTLTISAQNNNNATAVDAVEVVPEPSSIALLAAGAALAGLRRRRQQRAA